MRELTARLAEVHDVPVGAGDGHSGLDHFLEIIARTLLGPGLNAITSKLSFIVYPIVTRAIGARLIEVPTLNDGFDLERILDTIDVEHPRGVHLESQQSNRDGAGRRCD